MPARHVVLRYHEIALKGNNRRRFVDQLARNVRRILEGTGAGAPERGPGRLIVPLAEEHNWPEIRSRLTRVVGVANFLLSERTDRDMDAIIAAALQAVAGQEFATFAVRAKRADKRFPVQSPEIARLVGQAIREHTERGVDLRRPDFEIFVEITDRAAFVSREKTPGPGGLPLGSSGKVMVLLSGGIDSPVAARRMIQRGCVLEFVHFHAVPLQSRASQEKAGELAELLSRWQPDLRVHMVPFGDIQQRIVREAPRPVRVVLYRRMMVRIATALAREMKAQALVTGESLGQVASQTLTNIATIEDASELPVLRPLVGMDKAEIITQARVLGSYPISIQPDEDCCQLFIPRHPATHLSIEAARAAEASLDIPALVAAAVEARETLRFRFPPPKGSSRCL